MILTLSVGFLGGGILSEVVQGYLPVRPSIPHVNTSRDPRSPPMTPLTVQDLSVRRHHRQPPWLNYRLPDRPYHPPPFPPTRTTIPPIPPHLLGLFDAIPDTRAEREHGHRDGRMGVSTSCQWSRYRGGNWEAVCRVEGV